MSSPLYVLQDFMHSRFASATAACAVMRAEERGRVESQRRAAARRSEQGAWCKSYRQPAGPRAKVASHESHAPRSTIFARLAIGPARMHSRVWSPKAPTSPPHPGGPQRTAHKGKRMQACAKAGERSWSSGNASAHAAQYGRRCDAPRPEFSFH